MSIAEIRSGLHSFLARLRIWLDKLPAYDYMDLIKPYLLPIVVVFSAILGVATSLKRYSIIAFLVASLPILIIFLFSLLNSLQFAPIVLFFSSAFLPLYIPTGTESVIVDSLILTGMFVVFWILRMMIVDQRINLRKSPVNFPALGFMIVVPISLVWSLVFRDPLVKTWGSFIFVQAAETIVMILLPASMLLVANIVEDLKPLKYIVILFIFAGVIGYVYDIRYDLHIQNLFAMVDLEIKTGGLFTLWLVCLSIGFAIYDQKLSGPIRLFLLLLAGIWIYYRFWRNITWMTGWMPSLVALFVLIFMRSKKLILVLLVLFLLLVATNFNFFMNAFFAEEAESGSTRLMAWSTNLGLSFKHFLFGTGPGGYAAYYMSYLPNNAMATHNNYLDVIAQTGIVGIAFYLFMFFRLVTVGFSLCKRARGRNDFVDAMAHATFAGLIGCIVAMGFGDWMIPFPYTQGIAAYDYIVYSWLFLGSMLALDRLFPSSTEVVEYEDGLSSDEGLDDLLPLSD